MKASFLIQEMIYNTICSGKIMYIDGAEWVIDYIKCTPRTEDIQIHFTNGEVRTANENRTFDFKVNAKKQWKKATKKQIELSRENI